MSDSRVTDVNELNKSGRVRRRLVIILLVLGSYLVLAGSYLISWNVREVGAFSFLGGIALLVCAAVLGVWRMFHRS